MDQTWTSGFKQCLSMDAVEVFFGVHAFRFWRGVSGEVRFEIMGRGEAELHDDGFGSPMLDEALTATVSDEPEIDSPMSDKALTAADLAHRCWTKH
ncbi:hypothetical protein V6N11_034634 [Hibiscus sabdariffa]|uniref:Uncharacterized protein n=1 Tax=Hibiscus sabdariffa TaxID=183260 RepID=A0ABR2NDT1_9ROSI